MNLPPDQIISLSCVSGIGPKRIRAILRKYPDITDITRLKLPDLIRVEGISRELAGNILKMDDSPGKTALENILKINGRYLTYWEPAFPERLRSIYDAPIGIFVLGTLRKIPLLGVVGTRKPTTYGKKIAGSITAELVRAGLGIVSGMARGIDTIAHHACLEQGGYTIAVLGSGPDVCYPAGNRKLREEIVEKGAVISEFLPGTRPDAVNFPKRNRIISGLSRGILVVEAAKKSGAIISALYALDQNREVFAVPGPVNSDQSSGCHRLIQEGAKLVTDASDILEELNLKPVMEQVTLQPEPELTADEKKVFGELNAGKVHIDDLCRKLNRDTPEILSVLLMLELKNLVIQLPGKYFMKT